MEVYMKFKDKVVVITGGSLGIGRCLTREFTKAGARVAFVDMDRDAGEENLSHLKEQGGDAMFFCGDISEEQVLQDFAQKVVGRYQKVDYLIHNACLSKKGILEPCSYTDFNYVLRTGVAAPYFLTQLFLPYFNQGAAVVNISSTRAFMSQPNTESYTAAKGGITALTHALAISLSGRVRVNSVSPGWIDTGKYHNEGYVANHTRADIAQHPSRRVGEPEDIARAVFFLCDPDNSFVNGENITVDGGMTRQMIYSGDEGWTLEG
jgi:NAD(P)-dependent dehydrogenase (short-subunit alcohol dehydrogenase family)